MSRKELKHYPYRYLNVVRYKGSLLRYSIFWQENLSTTLNRFYRPLR